MVHHDPCYYLPGGIGAVVIGGLLAYASRKERYPLRLAARLESSPIGQLQEGMVQVAGRAVGTASIPSAVLGLNCLLTRTKLEAYDGSQSKNKWSTVVDQAKSVPFCIEDASGQVWVDPEGAKLELVPDLEFTTGERWTPSPMLEQLRWSQPGLEARLRDVYIEQQLRRNGLENMPEWVRQMAMAGQSNLAKAMEDPQFQERLRERGVELPFENLAHEMEVKQAERQAKMAATLAQQARQRTLRVTESNLLPGDPVYVIGPAFNSTPGSTPGSGAITPLIIRKGYPTDTFIISEGAPQQVQQRIRKESRKTMWMALGLIAVGLWMSLDCLKDHFPF